MFLKNARFLFLALLFFPHLSYAGEVNNATTQAPGFSTKILGGSESKSGDWPWITALLRSGQPDTWEAQYCSGVLVDKTWVLTAAHCVNGMNPGEIEVAVGVFDLKSFSGTRIDVKTIHVHPGYSTTTLTNDIALLELEQSSTQPPITLYSGQSRENVPTDLLSVTLTALGWGWANGPSGFYYPEKLRQVDLPVVDNTFCNDIYPYPLIASQLCAGYFEDKDVCNGDSGGPVVTAIDSQWVHVGLVSYGKQCDLYIGWYGVYTRTSEFVDFIRQYVPNARFTSKNIALPWLLLLTAH